MPGALTQINADYVACQRGCSPGLTPHGAHRRFWRMQRVPMPAERTPTARGFRKPSAAAERASSPCVADAAAGCYHCASPNPAGGRWRAFLNGAEREFCCAGCLAVANTIHAAGLESFYVARTAPADRSSPEAGLEAGDEWSHWDDAAAQAGLVRVRPGGEAEVSLLLEGIHCGACIWLHRILALAAAWRRGGERQLRHPPGARGVRIRTGAALRSAARRRARRLPCVSVRPGAARGVRAARIARAAAADGSRAAVDDAGDDVRGADLRHRRRHRAEASAAARMGEPHADAARAALSRRRRSSAARGATSVTCGRGWTCPSRSGSRPRSSPAPGRRSAATAPSITTR